MTREEFENVFKEQVKQSEETLVIKAKEYMRGDDRLHNFKRAAGIMDSEQMPVLMGMFVKHLVSIMDMVDDATIREGKQVKYPSKKMLDEKIGDAINYLILLKAMFIEEGVSE